MPRKPEHTERYAANTSAALALTGTASIGVLYYARPMLAGWMNPQLAQCARSARAVSHVHAHRDGPRNRHGVAAQAPGSGDYLRDFRHRPNVLFIGPALLFVSLDAVFVGAAILRHCGWQPRPRRAMALCGRELRIDTSLLRQQLGYALPFALAVGVDVVLINYHHAWSQHASTPPRSPSTPSDVFRFRCTT